MIRKNLKIIEHTINSGCEVIILEVEANGLPFVEYYVGVPKDHKFYSIKPSLRFDKDIRCLDLVNRVFGGRRSSPTFRSVAAMEQSTLTCIDGAWLSFARLGDSDDTKESYSFLKEETFYYGGGFQVRERLKDYDREASIAASYEIAEKMIACMNSSDIIIPPDTTKEEIFDFVQRSKDIPDKMYRVNPKTAEPISVFKKDKSFVGLYDYNTAFGNIYHLGNTDINIDSFFNITRLPHDGYNTLVFFTYIEALVAKTQYFPLNKIERTNLKEILENKKDYKLTMEESDV